MIGRVSSHFVAPCVGGQPEKGRPHRAQHVTTFWASNSEGGCGPFTLVFARFWPNCDVSMVIKIGKVDRSGRGNGLGVRFRMRRESARFRGPRPGRAKIVFVRRQRPASTFC